MLSWVDLLLATALWATGLYHFRRAVHRVAAQGAAKAARPGALRFWPDKAALLTAVIGAALVALGTVVALCDLGLALLVR